MKKLFFILILLLGIMFAFGQKYDTIITNAVYTSYFNYSLKVPVVVKYKLYKGGGECNRNKFRFTNDIKKLKTASGKDYAGSGYDKGHLANAEDFAYDCKLDKLTFRYYNCVPQAPEMNRGIWKEYETKIRDLSQTDSLLIIMVNTFDNHYMGNGVAVPSQFIKVVYSLTSHKVLLSFVVSNTSTPKAVEMPVAVLDKKYKIKIEKFR